MGFCSYTFAGNRSSSPVLLSTLGSNATFVKAQVYLAHGYTRIGFIRALAYLNISLVALESRKLRQIQLCCQQNGDKDAQDQVFIVLGLGHLVLIARYLGTCSRVQCFPGKKCVAQPIRSGSSLTF